MPEPTSTIFETRVWPVGALCRAVADALESRFNPVRVGGEISGFTRVSSGHCYFTLKDDSGQLRCAMFRRAAGLLDFSPRDGERVEVRGRLGVYEPKGELQLVVEGMSRSGQGVLFEQFLRLKAKLESEGLFDPARKRPLTNHPRAIGVVTSLGAAALHDVVTALQRRVPHIPVIVVPASVQGESAAGELVSALESLYACAEGSPSVQSTPVDVILLVRGGGAMEDLWAFNDERLARVIASSPVPVISGVGHETDFTIADFVADLRAPTPTAAAELASKPAETDLDTLQRMENRLRDALVRNAQREAQRLDWVASRMGRPSELVQTQHLRLAAWQQKMGHSVVVGLRSRGLMWEQRAAALPKALQSALSQLNERGERMALRLDALNPQRILQRGYAWMGDEKGHPVTQVEGLRVGQKLTATLMDGAVDLTVVGSRFN